MNKLEQEEIYTELKNLQGWSVEDNQIFKEFKKKDFSDTLAFMMKIGIESEKMDHHPDMYLYGWNNLKVTLSTHSAGGLTKNDFNLAKIIDTL
jgi:4a-hydroxytetrahydrobiopterin dehydratase